MSAKVYIMGCTVDGLAFQTAQEGLQHYNGKKHRLRMTRFLKNLTNEKNAIHIKGTSTLFIRKHLFCLRTNSLHFKLIIVRFLELSAIQVDAL
jgi:hypothetical protein